MSTPTPRTDAFYLEHRYWINEDEATEAIEDFRDLARTLERELATERARLDWLGSDAGMEFQWETTTVITRAEIEADLKEETK